MRWLRTAGWLLVAAGAACMRNGPKVEIGGYAFSYGGKEYRIESVTPNYSEGYNILIQREDDRLQLKGIDKEQDGELDDLLVGTVSLEEAKTIYREGILEGERRGYLRKRNFNREYKYSDAIYDYALDTYILATGETYNRLTLSHKHAFQDVAVLIDNEADGTIDRIDKGLESLVVYQKLYDDLVQKGIKAGRVVHSNNRFLVIP
jgi:hypothetical protein